MLTPTRAEKRMLQLVLLLAVSGLVGKVWVRTRPPSLEPPTIAQGVRGIR